MAKIDSVGFINAIPLCLEPTFSELQDLKPGCKNALNGADGKGLQTLIDKAEQTKFVFGVGNGAEMSMNRLFGTNDPDFNVSIKDYSVGKRSAYVVTVDGKPLAGTPMFGV